MQRRSARTIPVIDGLPDFWDRMRSARSILLMLDYDGTLAPFHVDRMRALPLPGALSALRRLDRDDAVSVMLVSGRPAREILDLIGDDRFAIAGSHGYEMHAPGAGIAAAPLTTIQERLLDDAFRAALDRFDPARVERKAASVAVHFRGVDPRVAEQVELDLTLAWEPAWESEHAELRPFNGGIELRAVGRTKGSVVREALAQQPPDVTPVYVGDDETDEDAFAALPPDGIGVKVGQPEAVTLAAGRLPDCEAVVDVLVALADTRGDVSE